MDNSVHLCDFEGNLVQTLKGHRSGIYGVSFSPDDRTLATASGDDRGKLWHLETGRELLTFTNTWHIGFSPAGSIHSVAFRDRNFRIFRAPEFEEIARREALKIKLDQRGVFP